MTADQQTLMAMKKAYQVGNPACLSIDMMQKTVDVTLSQSNDNIKDLWQQQFESWPETVVCVSGGLDSQFSANLAKQFCKKVHAVTFAYYWEGNLVNAHDVSVAQKFCEKLRLSHRVIDLDLKHFLQTDLSSTAHQYLTTSPQIATHLYSIRSHLIDLGLPILMGGEVPIVGQKDGIAVLPFRWPSTNRGGFAHNNLFHYAKLVLPYAVLSDQAGIPIVRDPFVMSGEIYYLAFMQNLQVIQDHQCIFDMSDPIRREVTDYKSLYYRSYEYEFLEPLKKRTGFEAVKVHLAMETGYYNEFDIRYRDPLYSDDLESATLGRPRFNTVSDKILEETQKVIDSCTLSSCNTYTFDW